MLLTRRKGNIYYGNQCKLPVVKASQRKYITNVLIEGSATDCSNTGPSVLCERAKPGGNKCSNDNYKKKCKMTCGLCGKVSRNILFFIHIFSL